MNMRMFRQSLVILSLLFCGMKIVSAETATSTQTSSASQPSTAASLVVKAPATTVATTLSDADIARINAEAAAAAAQYGNLGIKAQVKAVGTLGYNLIANPVTSLYGAVAPLGMFIIGFFDQAVKSILAADYMDSKLAILVDPKKQWDALVLAEKNAVSKLSGLKPAAAATTGTNQIASTGWDKKWTAGNVGVMYDFGFAGAGDDITQPFGFIRSEVDGKYRSRPIRGQFSPAKMKVDKKDYSVSFHQKPFAVLLPKLLVTMFGKEVAGPIWSKFLNFTQLDPIRIFEVKVLLLITTAFKNSKKALQKKVVKTTDGTQEYSSSSWTYSPTATGAQYPRIEHIYTELAKLVARLRVTPDIKRTIAANNGETIPSKWDLSKIIYMADIDLGALILSLLPAPLKLMLKLFKVKVNFYEYQAAIDQKDKVGLSDIDILCAKIRSYGTSLDNEADIFKKTKPADYVGDYFDLFVGKTMKMTSLVPGIVWQNGAQNFTDCMKLFANIRRLTKELYVGIEPIVTTYGEGALDSEVASDKASDGLQDSSVSPEFVAGESGYYKDINFDLLAKGVLPNRVLALKNYLSYMKSYTAGFISQKIGDSLVDARYGAKNLSQKASLDQAAGTADDLASYFPAEVMKKILSDYVALVGREADATLQAIDDDVASFQKVIDHAKKMNDDYSAVVASGSAVSEAVLNNRIDALDGLISELRKRQSAAQAFGLYPLGSEENILKILEISGEVYLAYCLNYQMKLLKTPFEGDKLYSYDDSFLDEDSSYLRLIAILFRANQDLARAGKIVAATSGEVVFKDAQGAPYTVASGTAFYVNSLRVYDQNFLIQEQKMRDARDKFGPNSKEFLSANEIYLNNKKLLQNKKKEMNNVLRTFAFDRRQDGSFKPVTVPRADSLKNAATAKVGALVSGNASLPSSTSFVAAGTDAVTGALSSTASNLEEGVVGMLEDGSIVYSYERTVNDFLLDELSSLAFRARMLNLDNLKEFVLALTGISAPDLWAGVETKKRLKLQQQQEAVIGKQIDAAAAAEAQALLDGSSELGDVSSGDALQEESIDETMAVLPVAVASPSVSGALEEPSLDGGSPDSSDGGVDDPMTSPFAVDLNSIVSADSQNSVAVSAPVAPKPAGSFPVKAVVAPSISAVAGAIQAPDGPVAAVSTDVTIEAADLDQVVTSASAQGMKSYVSDADVATLFGNLDMVFESAKKASLDKDPKEFAESLKDFVFTCAQVSSPSDNITSVMANNLQKIVGLMSFIDFDDGFSDSDSFENLLQVTIYLKNGLLSSQADYLAVVEAQIKAWIKSH